MQTTNRKIRVLVVDDSAVARSVIIQGLSASPRIEVVGYAVNAMDAKTKLQHLSPDVMTLDVEMPGINGIDFLKQFLPSHPLPVILVSSLNLRVFDALAAGAVDFVRKPDAVESRESFLQALTHKIIVASHARLSRANLPHPAAPAAPLRFGGDGAPEQTVIGLGASTGGTEATLNVLRRLPANIPGMVIVQHMPVGFTKMYAERLNRLCQMEVREAVNGDEIRPGLALVAPADYQAKVVRMGPRYTLSCRMVGIIMTGMGRDGASGLLEMRKAGAYTIGQDKDSCVVYGMPMVAHDIGAVTVQASCDNIASVLMNHLNNR